MCGFFTHFLFIRKEEEFEFDQMTSKIINLLYIFQTIGCLKKKNQ